MQWHTLITAVVIAICASPAFADSGTARYFATKGIAEIRQRDAASWYEFGNECIKVGSWKEAQDAFERASVLAGMFNWDRNGAGGCPSQVRYQEQFWQVLNYRAYLKFCDGIDALPNCGKAISSYKQALNICPSPRIWFYLAHAYHQNGQLDLSLDAYKEATGVRDFPRTSPIVLIDGEVITKDKILPPIQRGWLHSDT